MRLTLTLDLTLDLTLEFDGREAVAAFSWLPGWALGGCCNGVRRAEVGGGRDLGLGIAPQNRQIRPPPGKKVARVAFSTKI
jgi:hypothetical protein